MKINYLTFIFEKLAIFLEFLKDIWKVDSGLLSSTLLCQEKRQS